MSRSSYRLPEALLQAGLSLSLSLPSQTYVQDLLKGQLAHKVWEVLGQQGGHMYICGDVTMATGVKQAIQQILVQEGNMTLMEAADMISELQVRGA